jgi:hypothetical protein
MPEQYVFRCPCCGQMAPRERLDEGAGPFPLESFLQTFGGKAKLSDEERELRKGAGFRRGSGHGAMNYEQLEVDEELEALFRKRLEEIS